MKLLAAPPPRKLLRASSSCEHLQLLWNQLVMEHPHMYGLDLLCTFSYFARQAASSFRFIAFVTGATAQCRCGWFEVTAALKPLRKL
jgi:hypothetical protein